MSKSKREAAQADGTADAALETETGGSALIDDGSALIDDIATLPRVGEIGVQTRVMRAETEPPAKETPKANIGWRLKPFVPRVKKKMVTMSDLGMTGQVAGGQKPARRKKPE